MVAAVMESPSTVETKPLWRQVLEVAEKLKQMGRLSTRFSEEYLQGCSEGLLRNMLAGYNKQLEGSGRNQSV